MKETKRIISKIGDMTLKEVISKAKDALGAVLVSVVLALIIYGAINYHDEYERYKKTRGIDIAMSYAYYAGDESSWTNAVTLYRNEGQFYRELEENGKIQMIIGTAYANGLGGLEAFDSIAVKYFEKAITLDDNAEAKWQLGNMYLAGDGVSQDGAKGLALIKEASESSARGKLQLALLYLYGSDGVVDKDYRKAKNLFQEIMTEGEPLFTSYCKARAAREYGWMIENGCCGARDIEGARDWYKKAVDFGYKQAEEDILRLDNN